ncbi:MAG: hypothetical protein PS018_11625 [bacterium]|nr:hypothetical protein [bacterium]
MPVTLNHISGLTLSAAGATATFGIAAGAASDSTNADWMAVTSAYTKTTSAWVLGSAAGALDTGAIAIGTWYHVFQIKRRDIGTVDYLISLSPSAPTMPANYTLFRRIGSLKTDGSSQWVKFFQNGDDFTWDSMVADVNAATNPGTAAVLRTLTVPTGIKVEAKIAVVGSGLAGDPGPGAIYISDPAVADNAATINSHLTLASYTPNSGALVGQLSAQARVFTDTSARVRSRCQLSNANTRLDINTIGWIDRRGRDG